MITNARRKDASNRRRSGEFFREHVARHIDVVQPLIDQIVWYEERQRLIRPMLHVGGNLFGHRIGFTYDPKAVATKYLESSRQRAQDLLVSAAIDSMQVELRVEGSIAKRIRESVVPKIFHGKKSQSSTVEVSYLHFYFVDAFDATRAGEEQACRERLTRKLISSVEDLTVHNPWSLPAFPSFHLVSIQSNLTIDVSDSRTWVFQPSVIGTAESD